MMGSDNSDNCYFNVTVTLILFPNNEEVLTRRQYLVMVVIR